METTNGWKVGRVSDVGWRRVEAVGLGTGQDNNSRAGGTDGAKVRGHSTSLSGTAWTWHCDIRGAQGDNFGSQCGSAVRKKPRFTHVRDNLRGNVSEKRFSTHVREGNVAKIGDGGCGDDKGIESASGE